jgi:hypothetical protein
MRKLLIMITVLVGFVFMANVQVYALSSEVDIDELKAEIKEELRNEKPWSDEIDSWGIDVHGFVSQGYIQSQDNNYLANNSSDGTFGFNEVGINFSKQLTDRLRIGLQLFAHDLGAIGNNEVVLDWAFADYRWKDWAGLRVGRIKAPHGLYNETRDMDMLRTSIFLPQSVYFEVNRDTMSAINGVGVYGDIPAGAVGRFSYYLLAGSMDVDGDVSVGGIRQFNSSPIWENTGDLEFEEVYIAALEWQTPLDGLRLKYTYRTTALDIPGQLTAPIGPAPYVPGYGITYDIEKHSVYVYSAEYTWNNLVIAGEYSQQRSEWDVPELAGLAPAPFNPFLDQMSKDHGYYISAAYRINSWFEVGAYWSKFYADSDDKNGKEGAASGLYMYDYQSSLSDYALSFRFDINEYWVAKVEGHLMDGAAQCLLIDNNDFEEDWWMFAAKLSFSF